MIGFDFTGKAVCITGAGRGMGRVTALKFAECGANVAIADINYENAEEVAKEVETLGVKALPVKVNISKKAETDAMVEAVVKEFGRIDVLVNNAAVTMMKDMIYVTEEEFDKIFNVNVKGTMFCMQSVMKYFMEQKSGKIVNISSQAGKESFAHNTTYAASKAAIMSLTQGMAKEAGEYNVNVNAVCPGMIMTDLWTKDSGDMPGLLKDMESVDRFKGMSWDEMWEVMCKDILLGRAQTPEDIAMLVIFLSSNFADNMTGQGVNITGGMMLH